MTTESLKELALRIARQVDPYCEFHTDYDEVSICLDIDDFVKFTALVGAYFLRQAADNLSLLGSSPEVLYLRERADEIEQEAGK